MKIIQIGMNTSDIAGSLRLFSEAFGFQNAGGQCLWGETIRIQGLQPEDRTLMWWMVGRQDFFQLEFFHHSEPSQRPQPSDWRPNDHGWTRIGVAVDDFDACISALERRGVLLLSEPIVTDGLRRVAFRDPFVGTFVEVLERKEATDGIAGPSFVYATSSVADLESARTYYRDTIGLEIDRIESLHGQEHEALWGLAGAKRDGFVVKSGDIYLEIVEYKDPVGRPRRPDHLISDQGIMNVAVGTRLESEARQTFERLRAAGYLPPYFMEAEGIVAGYINDPGRELEIATIPEEVGKFYGFAAARPFMS